MESVNFYEQASQKISDEFVKDVFSKIEQICKRPKSHSIYFEEFRKASLSKFPFNIIYTLLDSELVIVSVWHKKREGRWNIRFKKLGKE